jgi:predicted esterase
LNQHWHPFPANAPRAKQEPHFTVSVKSILGLLEKHSSQRLVLVGFADGASVVAELLTDPDLPRSVVGAWLASGAILGEEEHWPERPRLASLPVLVSGARDIPEDGLAGDRMAATARFFEAAGGKVTRYLYEGPSALDAQRFGINAEEIKLAERLLRETRK